MELLDTLGLFSLVAAAVAVGGALAPLLRTALEKAIGFQFDKRLEEFRYGVRIREQAALVAEYLAIQFRLKATDDPALYRRLNQVGWELALYLPADTYRHVRDAVAGPYVPSPNPPPGRRNHLTALIATREYLLGDKAGDLTSEDIAVHYPNAGNNKNEQ